MATGLISALYIRDAFVDYVRGWSIIRLLNFPKNVEIPAYLC